MTYAREWVALSGAQPSIYFYVLRPSAWCILFSSPPLPFHPPALSCPYLLSFPLPLSPSKFSTFFWPPDPSSLPPSSHFPNKVCSPLHCCMSFLIHVSLLFLSSSFSLLSRLPEQTKQDLPHKMRAEERL